MVLATVEHTYRRYSAITEPQISKNAPPPLGKGSKGKAAMAPPPSGGKLNDGAMRNLQRWRYLILVNRRHDVRPWRRILKPVRLAKTETAPLPTQFCGHRSAGETLMS
jgi:hypothetical protein